jgi:PPOX class probable FMN-dependent enzyme
VFHDVIRSEAELRDVYRTPTASVQHKVLPRLDDHARRFIATSPFVLVGTSSPDGTADVSPKGGPPGFVTVLDDEHVAIGDLAGNNLIDTLTNIVAGSGIGLLFLVPGVDETLRVNGTACVTVDDTVLDACLIEGRRPRAALGITVREQFMHCAKAFRRSRLWQGESWPSRDSLPSLGCIVVDQIPEARGMDPALVDEQLEANYRETLWEAGGHD